MASNTLCGINTKLFANDPTPEELGKIVAHMDSEKQALFLLSLGEELRNCCGGSHFMQWQAIADSIKKIEAELCDGSASQLIEEIQCRLAPDEQQSRQTIEALVRALEHLIGCANAVIGADTSDPDAAEAFEMFDAARRGARSALLLAGEKNNE